MTSYVYIASGKRDDTPVMKVGKSNNPQQRERQIQIPIETTLECLTEAAAYRVESNLRQFIRERGGVRFKQTLDWFHFDPRIYQLLKEYLIDQTEPDGSEAAIDDIDNEIRAYRERYLALINEERDTTLKRVGELETEIQTLRQRVAKLQKEKDSEKERLLREMNELHRKIGGLEVRLELLNKPDSL